MLIPINSFVLTSSNRDSMKIAYKCDKIKSIKNNFKDYRIDSNKAKIKIS